MDQSVVLMRLKIMSLGEGSAPIVAAEP